MALTESNTDQFSLQQRYEAASKQILATGIQALVRLPIDLMRADPRVSFEVDRVESSDTWQSVVAEGEFEEVTDPDEIQMAVGLLEGATGVPVVMGDHSIVFRLRLTAKSGRYELPE